MTLKLEDVKKWLQHHGIDPADVCRTKGIRIAVDTVSSDAFLEVVTYKRNSGGKRFVDDMTREAAIETNMVPLQSFPERYFAS